jgi:preprotein translocase subunit SecA
MLGFLSKCVKKLMGGSRNDRIVRARMAFVAEQITPLEPQMEQLADADMALFAQQLGQRLADGEPRQRIVPEAFALVREATRRAMGIRLYDVQLAAGMVLDAGWIAEEATGEGKTFACYPAALMAILEGKHVHVVTVNDYLVERDAGFATQVFESLGYTVGFIANSMATPDRQAAYACNLTYGTNSEFGFDYLRDNMKMTVGSQAQSSLDFAIVDEIDSILIDEARTPLIISGPAYGDITRYGKVDTVTRELIRHQQPWDRANERVESLERDIRAMEGEIDKDGSDSDLPAQLEAKQQAYAAAERERAEHFQYYEVELDRKSVQLTHEGIGLAQDIAGVGSFYVGSNVDWPHMLDQSLRGHLAYEKDVDYVVQNGQVVIVDQFTGRLMEGRQWSDGLHQAVESKERVTVKEETQTLATITLQNFYRLYDKLAGMTGTAMTEAEEFMKIYKLDTAAVTTHRPINREDYPDRVYAEVDAKFDAIVEEIHEVSKAGRPVLVGTTSVEKSEQLSNALTRRYGIGHEVLNARPENAAREADIVAEAGFQRPLKPGSKEMVGNVTIATNMAGRGTDIKLGEGVVETKCGVPSDEDIRAMGLEPDFLYPSGVNKCCIRCDQYDPTTSCAHCFKPKLDDAFPLRGRTDCAEQVPCGLHIIGTERHEARRIDNQLRGRAGRQGDPGSSRFFLSLRDELMSIFAGEWTIKILGMLGLQGDVAIEHKGITKGIERAQRKVEERNFDIRKNLIEYDEVMDLQRKGTYSGRQAILAGRELDGMVMTMLEDVIEDATSSYLDGSYAARCAAEWTRKNLQVNLEPEDITLGKKRDLPSLERSLRDHAVNEAVMNVTMTLGEYMMDDADPKDWDFRGLSSWAMSRFGINLPQNQLRKMSPEDVQEQLIKVASDKIAETDLSHLVQFIHEDFAREALAEWATRRLGLEVTTEELSDDPIQSCEILNTKATEKYRSRLAEYPVELMLEATIAQAGTENVYACQDLADRVNGTFGTTHEGAYFQGRSMVEIRDELVALGTQWQDEETIRQAAIGALGSEVSSDRAIKYVMDRFDTILTTDEVGDDPVAAVVDAGRRFMRRDFARLEQFVLLQVYDSCWKDHLLAMDRLRDSIYIQKAPDQDPRVLFKRQGATLYYEMEESIREKVSDMIFKVMLTRQEDVSSVNTISQAQHAERSAYDGIVSADSPPRQGAQAQGGAPAKPASVRREAPKVGRNDPCPCGSGKKYKKCCGMMG